MAVSSHSKQPDPAWYFVQWATSAEVEKKMALQGIALPRPSVAKDPEYRKWIDEEPVHKEWQAALDVLATKGFEVGYPILANPGSQAAGSALVRRPPIERRSVRKSDAASAR